MSMFYGWRAICIALGENRFAVSFLNNEMDVHGPTQQLAAWIQKKDPGKVDVWWVPIVPLMSPLSDGVTHFHLPEGEGRQFYATIPGEMKVDCLHPPGWAEWEEILRSVALGGRQAPSSNLLEGLGRFLSPIQMMRTKVSMETAIASGWKI